MAKVKFIAKHSYSLDGIKINHFKAGDEGEVRDVDVEKLIKKGKIKGSSSGPTQAEIDAKLKADADAKAKADAEAEAEAKKQKEADEAELAELKKLQDEKKLDKKGLKKLEALENKLGIAPENK